MSIYLPPDRAPCRGHFGQTFTIGNQHGIEQMRVVIRAGLTCGTERRVPPTMTGGKGIVVSHPSPQASDHGCRSANSFDWPGESVAA